MYVEAEVQRVNGQNKKSWGYRRVMTSQTVRQIYQYATLFRSIDPGGFNADCKAKLSIPCSTPCICSGGVGARRGRPALPWQPWILLGGRERESHHGETLGRWHTDALCN